jgi:hypothetical protein
MLMAIDEPKIAMRSLRSVLSAEEFRELSERALEISARLEQSEQQRFAEVYPEVAPALARGDRASGTGALGGR